MLLAISVGAFVSFVVTSSVCIGMLILKSRKAAAQRWVLLNFSVAIWSLAEIFIINGIANAFTLFMWALGFFIPVTYLDFANELSDRRTIIKWIVGFGYVASVLLLILSFYGPVGHFRSHHIMQYTWGPGTAYFFFVLMLIIFPVIGIWELNHKRGTPKTSILLRNQLNYVILASIVGFPSGFTEILAYYGIISLPVGWFSLWLYPLIITYAILRHRLMDISVVIRKSLVYLRLTPLSRPFLPKVKT